MINTRRLQWFGFVTAIVFAGVSCGGGPVSALKTASIGAGGVKLIKIVSGAGVLKIDGVAGGTTADVRGRALGSSQRILSRIGLAATRSGDVVTISPRFPKRRWFQWGNAFLASLDMNITLPAGIPIEITDGRGDIVARGVGPVTIKDGPGGINLQGISGSVDIRDGSGDIAVNGVSGDVKVKDGSGGISVRNITGDLNVPADGSGALSAQRVGGSVRVADKGSGTMKVAHVVSDLIVGEKGSGPIRYEDIRGQVAVPRRKQ